MDPLFYPKSVAVIGVSESPDNLASNIVHNLVEFQFGGGILLVGKKEGILHGRKIHTSMDSLHEKIDVAVILTPAPTVAPSGILFITSSSATFELGTKRASKLFLLKELIVLSTCLVRYHSS